tara:strand:- start:64776 stop:66080 length:1305 start_codon:yes stop_codon:yes gene_type:complete
MKDKREVVVCWFRRDLRLTDNTAFFHALTSGLPVIPLFIFDTDILEELPATDGRVTFIHHTLKELHTQLAIFKSGMLIKKGEVSAVWKTLQAEFTIKKVFFNNDYEPYAIQRDTAIKKQLETNGIAVSGFKDDVIFEANEVLKNDQSPYTVFTPYKNKWLSTYHSKAIKSTEYKKELLQNCLQFTPEFPTLAEVGFEKSTQVVEPYQLDAIENYEAFRDFPAKDQTSYLSPHLRFGTVSIRKLVLLAQSKNAVLLSELIWREFFKQILVHFPKVVTENFKASYNGIQWRTSAKDFKHWCDGTTGYPLVDAGMRQLNATGYMHNRVRMVTAGFLCKHLLLDWRLGEAYFAKHLLDYELSSNNGNWQWAAGTGCDAAPYFRVFNPEAQQKKFDKDFEYIKKWIPEFETNYGQPIVEHKLARERAIATYKAGIQKKG